MFLVVRRMLWFLEYDSCENVCCHHSMSTQNAYCFSLFFTAYNYKIVVSRESDAVLLANNASSKSGSKKLHILADGLHKCS